MKVTYRLVLVLSMVTLMAGSLMAKKARKLPAKAYVSSAKIEVIGYAESHERLRIETAIALLDSLFMYYGPHPEGYYWYSQIQWDLAGEKADLRERLPVVQKAIVYADSLKWSCSNKDVDKKYRKDCEDLDEEMDSIRVLQWRQYYSDGVEQISEVEELMQTVKVEEDSSSLAYYQTRLDALVDSCQDRLNLAIAIDSTDSRPFVGLASVNEKIGNFAEAIEFLKQALPKAEDRNQILLEIANDYIRADDYCGAIPWFQEYVDSMSIIDAVMEDPNNRAAVLGTAHNLAICCNNCEDYATAYTTYHRILEFDPFDQAALVGAGRYHQHKGREATDSARTYREQEDEASSISWNQTRDERFDSAIVYLGRAFESSQDDAVVAAEYGLMLAIRTRYEEAKIAFARASELAPGEADYWISLGDCTIQLQDWTGSAEAYEHVVELQPDNKEVWQQLANIYEMLQDETRRAEALQKLESL